MPLCGFSYKLCEDIPRFSVVEDAFSPHLILNVSWDLKCLFVSKTQFFIHFQWSGRLSYVSRSFLISFSEENGATAVEEEWMNELMNEGIWVRILVESMRETQGRSCLRQRQLWCTVISMLVTIDIKDKHEPCDSRLAYLFVGVVVTAFGHLAFVFLGKYFGV